MRIVAMSDQHGEFPKVPECDLLIVAGDCCPDKFGGTTARVDARPQVAWFRNYWLSWRNKQPATRCLVTWGNHDYCGAVINRASPVEQIERYTWAIIDDYWMFERREGTLKRPPLKIWLTPWSSRFRDWAFMQDESRLKDLYSLIPDGLDILVTHQPPFGTGDRSGYLIGGDGSSVEHIGSPALLNAILRAKPKVVICGHVHTDFGRFEIEVPDADPVILYNVAVVDDGYRLVRQPTLIKEF